MKTKGKTNSSELTLDQRIDKVLKTPYSKDPALLRERETLLEELAESARLRSEQKPQREAEALIKFKAAINELYSITNSIRALRRNLDSAMFAYDENFHECDQSKLQTSNFDENDVWEVSRAYLTLALSISNFERQLDILTKGLNIKTPSLPDHTIVHGYVFQKMGGLLPI